MVDEWTTCWTGKMLCTLVDVEKKTEEKKLKKIEGSVVDSWIFIMSTQPSIASGAVRAWTCD